MGFINDAGGGTARNIRDIDRDRDRDRDRRRNNSYDTQSMDNLAKAIHDGSYQGKNDSRWSRRDKDGYSSFGRIGIMKSIATMPAVILKEEVRLEVRYKTIEI